MFLHSTFPPIVENDIISGLNDNIIMIIAILIPLPPLAIAYTSSLYIA